MIKRTIALGATATLLVVIFLLARHRLFRPSSNDRTIAIEHLSETASIYVVDPPEAVVQRVDTPTAMKDVSDGSSKRRTRRDRPSRSDRLENARQALLSKDLSIKPRAIRTIKRMGSEEDLDMLADLVTRVEDQRIKVAMIRALRERETPESMQALSECLTLDNPRVQKAAVRSLANMKDPAAREYLAAALDDGYIEDKDVTQLIRKAIGASSGEIEEIPRGDY
jgi:hypothetical protein